MKRVYKISYVNNKGQKVTAKAKAENSENAMYSYANRKVFGGNTIFCNVSTKMCDADTYGQVWGIFRADGIIVVVDVAHQDM